MTTDLKGLAAYIAMQDSHAPRADSRTKVEMVYPSGVEEPWRLQARAVLMMKYHRHALSELKNGQKLPILFNGTQFECHKRAYDGGLCVVVVGGEL